MPRHYVEHLDNEPPHNIQAWIASNEARWEASAGVPLGLQLSDSRLEALATSWVAFREKRGYGIKNTRTRADHALRDDVVPYFLLGQKQTTPPCKADSYCKSINNVRGVGGVRTRNRLTK